MSAAPRTKISIGYEAAAAAEPAPAAAAEPRAAVRGLPHYQTVVDKDSTGTTALVPTGPVQRALPVTPKCGQWECLNGPPIFTNRLTMAETVFETYALCPVCKKAAPDPYAFGHSVMPSKWLKPRRKAEDIADEKKDRRNKAASVLGGHCLLELAARYPTVYGSV